MENIIEARNISKSYERNLAIKDINLSVPRASIYGLLGPNGAGKTTFIRILTQIIGPDTGEIMFNGRPLERSDIEKMGYMPEERGLYRKMKVGEQIEYFSRLKGMTKAESYEAIRYWFTIFDIKDWWGKKVEELSKGMQQKVQFITAVIHDPDLVILDEPFSGLDPVNVDLMKETILEQKAAGKAIILSTHQMEIAEKLCDDVCMINRAHKVLDGTLRDIKRSFSRNAVALQFDGGDGLLNDPALVANIGQNGEDTEVLLVPGARPQTLLKRLVEAGVNVSKFELVEPSLHDIFIEKVRETA